MSEEPADSFRIREVGLSRSYRLKGLRGGIKCFEMPWIQDIIGGTEANMDTIEE